MNRQNSLWRNGPLWLTASAVLFAVMAVAVRLAGERGIPGSETTFIRFLTGLVAVGALHKSGTARVRIRQVPLLVGRGTIGGIAILLYFASLSAAKGTGSTSLTSSVFLGNSYFIYLPLLGALLIHERLRPGTVLMVMVALAGLYLIVNPRFVHIRSGDAYGFLAGLMSAVAIVIIRELRKTEQAITVFFALCVFGGLAALATMAVERPIWPGAMGWLLLLIMGISSTAGQLTMTHGLGYTGVGEAGVIQMSTVVYSSLVGVLWLADPFDVRILVGAALVLVSAAYISFADSLRAREC